MWGSIPRPLFFFVLDAPIDKFGYLRDCLLVKKNAPVWSAKTLTFSLPIPSERFVPLCRFFFHSSARLATQPTVEMPMLLARTPMKPAGDVCEDVPKPVKWLRCLQCNQKFPEDRFREHQRESKSPCELVRPRPSHRRRADARRPGGIASARVGRARVVSSVYARVPSRVTRFCPPRTARRAHPAPRPPRPFARPRQDLPAARGSEATPGASRDRARARHAPRAFPREPPRARLGDVAPARRVAFPPKRARR